MKIVYSIENLDCPHCASVIEHEIQKLEGIETASLSFATKQLHLRAKTENGLLERIQKTADRVENGVIFKELGADPYQASHVRQLKQIVFLAIGVLLFLLGITAEWLLEIPYISKGLMLAAYLFMGWEVLLRSLKNIAKGRIFDENFLMSIATIGAMAIGCWEEAAGVMLFFRVGEMFEHLAVERSRKSIMEAIDLRPETVQRLKDDELETIPAEKVTIGDVLVVRAGDRIPVDGRILNGDSSLDTSAMTGESMPVQVQVGDTVMSGCINLSGVLKIEATAALRDSMVSRILDSVENAAAGKPRIDRFITRFARIYTPIVVGIAILTAIVPSLFTGEWEYWVYTALNFLMISCPCALVLSVPLAFFSGIGAGCRKGILFKDGISLEMLSKIKAVVMDKTGTLTNGIFSVSFVETNDCSVDALLKICASCETASSHPIAQSIVEYAKQMGVTPLKFESIIEIAGKGMIGECGGKKILCGNSTLLVENGISIPEITRNGAKVYVAEDGNYRGCIILSDLPKPTATSAMKQLHKRGIFTAMLTGDSKQNAQSIAEELGIDESHAELLPDEKLEHMQKIRSEQGRVLFVGDGINDAPVLSGADVGAAMGSGAEAAMEVADVVFLSSDPLAITDSISIADRVNQTAKINIVFALLVKLLIMLMGFAGFANMWLSVFADTGVTILCVLIVLLRIHFYYRTN